MTVPPRATLPQLLDPATYRPCEWDLAADPRGRAYWVRLFTTHLDLLTDLIAHEYPRTNGRQVAAFRQDYMATMRSFDADSERFAPADVLRLTALRRDLLTRHRFPAPFLGVKQRENEAALALLPGVLAELEGLPADAQLEALAVGLMAGNIFDLGSPATIAQYQAGLAGFREARARQPARPWLIDDLERWQARWRAAPYRHVFWFVDNAGSDIWLGCIPLVCWMLRAGAGSLWPPTAVRPSTTSPPPNWPNYCRGGCGGHGPRQGGGRRSAGPDRHRQRPAAAGPDQAGPALHGGRL